MIHVCVCIMCIIYTFLLEAQLSTPYQALSEFDAFGPWLAKNTIIEEDMAAE